MKKALRKLFRKKKLPKGSSSAHRRRSRSLPPSGKPPVLNAARPPPPPPCRPKDLTFRNDAIVTHDQIREQQDQQQHQAMSQQPTKPPPPPRPSNMSMPDGTGGSVPYYYYFVDTESRPLFRASSDRGQALEGDSGTEAETEAGPDGGGLNGGDEMMMEPLDGIDDGGEGQEGEKAPQVEADVSSASSTSSSTSSAVVVEGGIGLIGGDPSSSSLSPPSSSIATTTTTTTPAAAATPGGGGLPPLPPRRVARLSSSPPTNAPPLRARSRSALGVGPISRSFAPVSPLAKRRAATAADGSGATGAVVPVGLPPRGPPRKTKTKGGRTVIVRPKRRVVVKKKNAAMPVLPPRGEGSSLSVAAAAAAAAGGVFSLPALPPRARAIRQEEGGGSSSSSSSSLGVPKKNMNRMSFNTGVRMVLEEGSDDKIRKVVLLSSPTTTTTSQQQQQDRTLSFSLPDPDDVDSEDEDEVRALAAADEMEEDEEPQRAYVPLAPAGVNSLLGRFLAAPQDQSTFDEVKSLVDGGTLTLQDVMRNRRVSVALAHQVRRMRADDFDPRRRESFDKHCQIVYQLIGSGSEELIEELGVLVDDDDDEGRAIDPMADFFFAAAVAHPGPKKEGWGFEALQYIVESEHDYKDQLLDTLIEKNRGRLNEPMLEAAEHQYFDDVVKRLIANGADVNFQHPNTGDTVMHIVAKSPMRRIRQKLEWLVSKGGNAEIVNNLGLSVLDVCFEAEACAYLTRLKSESQQQQQSSSSSSPASSGLVFTRAGGASVSLLRPEEMESMLGTAADREPGHGGGYDSDDDFTDSDSSDGGAFADFAL